MLQCVVQVRVCSGPTGPETETPFIPQRGAQVRPHVEQGDGQLDRSAGHQGLVQRGRQNVRPGP